MGDLIDIAEVRARTGLSVATLHHYESLGLIRGAGRAGLRRQYEVETLQRLAMIVRGQQVGLRLADIGEVLSTDDGAVARGVLEKRLAELRARMRALRRAEQDLVRALRCTQPIPSECEQFHRQAGDAIPVAPRRRQRRGADSGLDA